MICHKTSGTDYRIPFELPFQIPTVTPHDISPLLLVDATLIRQNSLVDIVTVEDAISLYLTTFSQQFFGQDTLKKKRRILNRFLKYLQQSRHSQLIDELTTEDGQLFMDSLDNIYTGRRLTAGTRRRYGGVLRTFGRFLFDTGLHEDDVFGIVT